MREPHPEYDLGHRRRHEVYQPLLPMGQSVVEFQHVHGRTCSAGGSATYGRAALQVTLVMVWNFELYMLPASLLLLLTRNLIIEYREGRLGKAFSGLGDETIAAIVQPVAAEEEIVEPDPNSKVNRIA